MRGVSAAGSVAVDALDAIEQKTPLRGTHRASRVRLITLQPTSAQQMLDGRPQGCSSGGLNYQLEHRLKRVEQPVPADKCLQQFKAVPLRYL